jgi:hypothetical protein
MGAWGADTFDNDTACDWSYQLKQSNDLALVVSAIAAVLDAGDEYIESDAACEALAACEVIARLKGNWGVQNPYTEPVDNWVKAHPLKPAADLVACANDAIDRILAENSELPELWDGSEGWGAAVEDLRRRVRA